VGGFTDLTGCNLTIGSSGALDVRGPDAGQNFLTAREQLTVQGTLTATRTTGTGTPGENRFAFPSRKPPIVTGTVTPPATTQAFATCTPTVTLDCLTPCPTCGNGIIEFPETCDTAGTPTNCDGCTIFCRTENCDDDNVCTADSCDPTIGCRHDPTREGLSCSDGDVCNGLETCRSGFCTAGPPLCDDRNSCTRNVCDPVLATCSFPPANAGTSCSDGNGCTVGDSCDGLGACQPGPPRVCQDSRECTTDTCDPSRPSGCVFTPRTGTCTDDGNACTNDVCAGATCTHPTIPGCTTTTSTSTTTTTSSTTTTTRPPCRLDVDGNGQAQTATDVVYIARRLFGIPPVPPSFRASDPTIPPDSVIIANITALCPP
jgi:cysteine-rich repeat protein